MASHEKELEDRKSENDKLKIQLVESEEKWKELKDAVADMRLEKTTNNERNYDELKKRLTFGVRKNVLIIGVLADIAGALGTCPHPHSLFNFCNFYAVLVKILQNNRFVPHHLENPGSVTRADRNNFGEL